MRANRAIRRTDLGSRQVTDTVGEIFVNTENPCITVERPQPEFPKTPPFLTSPTVSGMEPTVLIELLSPTLL